MTQAASPDRNERERIDRTLANKREQVIGALRSHGSVIVALSGGVDSAVLLALAVEALGAARVLAVTARSASLPERERADALAVADALGARHETVDTREMDREAYRANAGDRCYHCRSELFETLDALARDRGIERVAYGAIRDDLGDFRPGMAAADEHRALAPLLDAGITKEDVRRLAAAAGLPVRDKPASACLASRIPPGERVTPEKLALVGRAESALRDLGFGQLRVRYHGDVARLELDPAGMARIEDPAVRDAVVRAVRAAGFRHVAVDLEGYRTGSLNPRPPDGLHRIAPARPSGQ